MAFHPYPQVIVALFNVLPFGPPRGLTPASACPGIAHPASRPARATRRPVRTRLLCGSLPSLTSPRASDSLAHSTKGTPSHQKVLRLLVGARFQVLFHSPPGVLFTFPSRYSSTIGRRVVFRLGWWSTQVRTGFHVPGPTQGPPPGSRCGWAYGALTLCGRPSHAVPPPARLPRRELRLPGGRPYNPGGAKPSGRVRSPVWPLSISLAATLEIEKFSFSSSPYLDVSVQAVPLHTLWIGVWMHEGCSCGFPHSDICGSVDICSSPQLFAAYHVFLRLLVPRHPPCALFCLTSLLPFQ